MHVIYRKETPEARKATEQQMREHAQTEETVEYREARLQQIIREHTQKVHREEKPEAREARPRQMREHVQTVRSEEP